MINNSYYLVKIKLSQKLAAHAHFSNTLDLSGVFRQMSAVMLPLLATLPVMTDITHVVLAKNHIAKVKAKGLFQTLKALFPNLQTIDLSDNAIADKKAMALLKACLVNFDGCTVSINLSDNLITADGQAALLKHVADREQVSVDLKGNFAKDKKTSKHAV